MNNSMVAHLWAHEQEESASGSIHLFARVREEEYKYECLGGLRYKECIPYQGNEHLLGTNKNK